MSATPLAPRARTSTAPAALLRRYLLLDAGPTTATGVAFVVAPGPIGDFLGYGTAPVLAVGVFLTLFGGFVGWLSTRRRPPLAAVHAVVDVNAVWAVASLAVLAFRLDPTPVGVAYGVLQAVVVGALAVLQFTAARRVAAESRP
ncbi:hypothetical protein [Streptomyces sp. NPDC060194]|uniref:hypothetical protein n=1 Tax=Streptomyces sp. NPDC060194 TaxID=3347069 RepID=UPI0036688F79